MREQKRSVAIALVIIKNDIGNVLISQRYDPAVPECNLKWDLPGGANEYGETLEQTAVREVGEETGLHVKIKSMIPFSQSAIRQHTEYELHTVAVCFVCSFQFGEMLIRDHKIRDLRWIHIDELSSYTFIENSKRFLDYYKSNWEV